MTILFFKGFCLAHSSLNAIQSFGKVYIYYDCLISKCKSMHIACRYGWYHTAQCFCVI